MTATEEQRMANNIACRRYRKNCSPEQAMYARSIRRAREKEVPHDISVEDIEIPAVCPILGIPLKRSPTGRSHAASPTLVTIDYARGYVLGNIAVVSFKASYDHYAIVKWWHDTELINSVVKDLTDAVPEEKDSTSDE